MVFSSFAVAAICLQPLLGWVTDKLGPKKHLLWLIVILMVLFAPFFIYVYTPLLQSHFAIGLVVGGLYLGFIFHAGYGAVEAFVEKVSRNRALSTDVHGCLAALGRRPARLSPVFCMVSIRHGFTGLVRRWLCCWW
ncbi:galactoside permease [Salmonella enterica subsp. arizonae]|uniref:Galactoside permease n=1 Tax=Salmonella enterica subsp. arizonae TaxID=59203 RepID=A0A379SCF3_SALER|nr:galactoside permease [Salmonella enterica subsp. arizonae]